MKTLRSHKNRIALPSNDALLVPMNVPRPEKVPASLSNNPSPSNVPSPSNTPSPLQLPAEISGGVVINKSDVTIRFKRSNIVCGFNWKTTDFNWRRMQKRHYRSKRSFIDCNIFNSKSHQVNVTLHLSTQIERISKRCKDVKSSNCELFKGCQSLYKNVKYWRYSSVVFVFLSIYSAHQ